jgi:hypothetical protein
MHNYGTGEQRPYDAQGEHVGSPGERCRYCGIVIDAASRGRTCWQAPRWRKMVNFLLIRDSPAHESKQRPSPPVGCCSACRGTGIGNDPETNGLCWDCRGTGCAHPDPCHDERCEAEFITGPNAWSPCDCASRKGTQQ